MDLWPNFNVLFPPNKNRSELNFVMRAHTFFSAIKLRFEMDLAERKKECQRSHYAPQRVWIFRSNGGFFIVCIFSRHTHVTLTTQHRKLQHPNTRLYPLSWFWWRKFANEIEHSAKEVRVSPSDWAGRSWFVFVVVVVIYVFAVNLDRSQLAAIPIDMRTFSFDYLKNMSAKCRMQVTFKVFPFATTTRKKRTTKFHLISHEKSKTESTRIEKKVTQIRKIKLKARLLKGKHWHLS